MARKNSIFYVLCAVLYLCAPAAAQEAVEPLTFKEALRIAYDQNPRMIEAREAVSASKGERITARTPQNPEVEFEEDVIEIRQPFGPPGAGLLNAGIASNDVKIQEASLRAVWTDVYMQVRDVYANIVLNKKRLELTSHNLESMRQFFGRVQTRYESGQALKNELQRAKIEMLQSENDHLSAQKDLTVERARLNLALGRPMETSFEIVEELKEESLNSTYEALKRMTLENRPDVQIAELELDSHRKLLAKEQLSRLPSWYVGVQRTDEEEEEYAMLFGVEIPIWNFNQGAVRKAEAARSAQQARTEAVKNQAAFEVYDMYLTAQLHQRQLAIARKSLDESNELFRLATLRYSEGKIDFLDYLDQVTTAKEAKLNYYEALFRLNRSLAALEISVYTSLREGEEFLR